MAVDAVKPPYTHYISIDFGTSGCAIAVGFSNPKPDNISVFSGWNRLQFQVKHPTILLVDPKGKFVSFGEKALKKYKELKDQAKDYFLFHRFKMKLYDAPVRHIIMDAKLHSYSCFSACSNLVTSL